MGALDFITKPLSVVANTVESVCDAVLPKELEFVGDIASGAVNYTTGNWLGLVEDGLDFLENVQNGDIFRFATELVGVDLDLGQAEPGPPPGPSGGQGWRPLPPGEAAGADEPTAALKEAKAAAASSPSKAAASNSPASAPASGAGSSAKATAKGKSESAGKQAALDFMNTYKDPEALMSAIKNGGLPPEVAESQTGMMMIQQKLQDLQRMMQLMTQMLQAMHEMNMAIVRNVRA